MTTLVIGASGATGTQLVEQLLHRGQSVRAIVRSPDNFPTNLKQNPQLSLIQASILDLSEAELAQHLYGCNAVASCLGHNMTWKGIFGPPRRLVTDATQRVCNVIKANPSDGPVKFVLMNTAGNRNRDRHEPISLAQKVVIALIRLLLPPHTDNEQAAEYLRTQIGPNDGAIEWVVIRPDTLINEDQVKPYEIHASPKRSAIFDPGSTSRINVGHFMAHLMTDADEWNQWMGQMPVIYNKE